MGKKGSKRKTRWRTLSIGAPPGEEDEEDELRNGYVKNRDADNGSVHSFDRNDQSGRYKPRRGTLVGNSTVGSTAGGGSGGSRSRRDETPGSPSQPKIIFNEDEYTRITTPRQDVLFKKSYLSRKKPWASNASTSATPSTTESQSASHSTADGSETTEDQQLLDRDCGAGEYMAPVVEPGAQISYGTFYDHGSGYYYEYPVMLVGPAPIPAPVGPNVLAAVPCGPVPLRPIEWINPAFVPKLTGQPYCLMDYQTGHSTEGATLDEISDFPQPPMDISNGTCNESGTGSASCSGSVVGEMTEEQQQVDETSMKNVSQDEEQEQDQNVEQQQQDPQPTEDQRMDENGVNESGTYLEPVLIQQPVHMTHVQHVPHVPHVVSAVPQPYMYPGHYMFGPPLVNVNGVTIQGGPMIRTTDVAAMAAAYAKRRKKKKRRKQRRPASGNAEGDEEEEYSSECDNGILSSRLSWSACPTSTADNLDPVSGNSVRAQNRPLNPECQEFQLRPAADERDQSREKCASPSLLTTSDDAPNSDGTTSNPIDTLSSTMPGSVAQEAQSESNGSVSLTFGLKDTHAESSSSLSSTFGLKDTCESNGALSPNSERVNEATKEGHSPNKAERRRRRRNINLDASQMNGTSTVPGNENASREVVMSNGKVEVKVDAEDGRLKEKCVLTNGESGKFAVSKVGQDVPSETSRREPSTAEPEKVESKKSTESRRKAESGQSSEVKQSSDSRQNSENSVPKSRRKYSSKGAKFVREPTPGPDLTDESKEVTEGASEKVSDSKSDKEVTQKKQKEKRQAKNSTKESKKSGTESNQKSESRKETLASTVAVDTTNPIAIFEGTVAKDAQRAGLDSVSSEANDIETKAVSDGIAECSTEDSGFESQTRTSDYPITEAVTEWLRKANSPEMFVTSDANSASDSEDNGEEVDEDVEIEDMDKTPSKNLQGNPMPALSANGEVHSSWANRGEFARSTSREEASLEDNDRVDLEVGSREWERNARNRPDGMSRKLKRNAVINAELRTNHDGGALQGPNPLLNNAHALTNSIDAPTVDAGGKTCEFTGKDSTAGMRVASSSRMGLKKVESGSGGRRRSSRRSGKYKRDLAEVVNVKIIRRSDGDSSNDLEDTISVRTFEKGEIVVSAAEGKLLPITSYEPFLGKDLTPLSETSPDGFKVEEVTPCSTSERERNCRESESLTSRTNVLASSLHIEEPDVLECWEAETIEPVITPKKMVQGRGVSYDGEAAEEDCFEPEPENVERVQRYYRLAEESVISVEEETDVNDNSVSSCASNPFARTGASMPNSPDQPVVETPVCYEETPTSSERRCDADLGRIPVEEAFEVYESCYTAKPRIFAFDANVFKPRPLRQDGEGPVPCRAACCNIQ